MQKRVTFSLNEELMNLLKEKSLETSIPQSKIVEMAITEKLESMKSTNQ